jgi:hypothetical protein
MPARFLSCLIALALLAGPQAPAEERVVRVQGVELVHEGIAEPYANAIVRTTAAARAAAVEEYGFDLPETIRVSVRVQPGEKERLYTDGAGQITQVLGSERGLLKPAVSGIFNVYGYCHETGHMAMYRAVAQHSWMTTAAAEGWAHYLGSRLLDSVYRKEGKALWPDQYDYLADGTQRLKRDLARPDADEVTRGAGKWQELAALVGDRGFAKIFKAWGAAPLDPAAPSAGLERALAAATGNNARVAAWWKQAEPLFVQTRKRSAFASRSVPLGALRGKAQELALDDGVPAGKFSFSGGGHAVRFKAPGPEWFLTKVQIFGSRYGAPQAPAENFHVFVCDKDGGLISDCQFPYARFGRGVEQWVALDLDPLEVPAEFLLCVSFNPTATKGVYVFYDKAGSGSSLSGLPEYGFEPFRKGDWLIRVSLDQLGKPGVTKP